MPDRAATHHLEKHRAEGITIRLAVCFLGQGEIAEDHLGVRHVLAVEKDVRRLEVTVRTAAAVAQFFEGLEDARRQPAQRRVVQQDPALDQRIERMRVMRPDAEGVVAFQPGFKDWRDLAAARVHGRLLFLHGAQETVAVAIGPRDAAHTVADFDGHRHAVRGVHRPGMHLGLVAPAELALEAVFLGDKHQALIVGQGRAAVNAPSVKRQNTVRGRRRRKEKNRSRLFPLRAGQWRGFHQPRLVHRDGGRRALGRHGQELAPRVRIAGRIGEHAGQIGDHHDLRRADVVPVFPDGVVRPEGVGLRRVRAEAVALGIALGLRGAAPASISKRASP